ncbi:hypothetical protein R3P38DRAFT_2870579 [Favolaschia claudopus]|uniref:Transmembrane protein 53 n=1 Tax=Favolaschia claudopus TaxID=2862362 RepID=A0AAW0DCN3_9AGAR
MASAQKASAPAQAPNLEFRKLANDIYLASGDRTGPRSPDDPRLIILFGWMNAPLRLLHKYALKHRANWPTSDIIIVESYPAWLWSREKTQVDIMKPLASYLISTIYSAPAELSDGPPGILMHLMSNGGAFHLTTLTKILFTSDSNAVRTGPNIRFATAFDSAPGEREYRSLVMAASSSFQSPIVKALMRIPLSLIWLYLGIRNIILRQPASLAKLHADLQVDQLLPRTDRQAPRVYIYSAADIMVPAHGVEKHLAVLKNANPPFDVEVEKFTNSPHILHERTDPERYWSAVRRVWDRSAPTRAKL